MRDGKLTQYLNQRLTFLLIPLTALLLAGTPAFAMPKLVVNGGILEGATGVDVGGTLYDVTFMDGTCIDLFNGCDAVSDFTFQTAADALLAAQALLNQVLVDGGLGIFDAMPQLTSGCPDATMDCSIYTPYGFSVGPLFVDIAKTFNHVTNAFDSAVVGPPNSRLISAGTPPAGISDQAFARWTVSAQAPIPEPTTMMLLSTGLLGLVGYRWRQGRREGQHIG